jgi:hypothetical protein
MDRNTRSEGVCQGGASATLKRISHWRALAIEAPVLRQKDEPVSCMGCFSIRRRTVGDARPLGRRAGLVGTQQSVDAALPALQ